MKDRYHKLFVGSRFTYPPLGVVRVVGVHPAGTVDVEGSSGAFYRITGLAIGRDGQPMLRLRKKQ